MTKELQQNYVENLNMFIQSLQKTNIMFFYFEARKLDSPKIETVFGHYGDWYISPGEDINYCYAYAESEIKYIVSNIKVRQTDLPIVISKGDLANIGNHIDFSIHKSRQDVFFKVHYTAYSEVFESDDELVLFTRDASNQCNFLVDKEAIMSKKLNVKCVDSKNKQINEFANVFYDKNQAQLVHDLCKKSIQRESKHLHQLGGVDQGHSSSYKGFYIIGQEIHKFVLDTFIQPLITKISPKRGVDQMFAFLDQHSFLDPKGSKSIQYIVEFSGDRVVVFSISTHRALKACWTMHNKSIASEKEKKCLKQWMKTCATLVN